MSFQNIFTQGDDLDGGDYNDCCSDGTREYQGNDRVYRFELDVPAQVSIILEATEAMGAFICESAMWR